MTEAIFLLLATYFAHSTIFVASAWAIERSGMARTSAARELLWRCALLAGIATASLQFALPSAVAAMRDARAPVSEVAVATVAPSVAVPLLSQPVVPQAESSQGTVAIPRHDAPRAEFLSMRPAWALPAATRALADWIAMLWLLTGIAGALTLAFAVKRRASVLARLVPCTDPAALAFVTQIARTNGMRAPRVVEDPESTSPTANLGGVLTLPPWALGGIESQGLEAMLAHELGHLARRDMTWRVVTALVRTVFWFQPLNGLASRRLEVLAELGADSWAVGTTGNRRALAQCLARCATEIGRARAPAPNFAIAMTGGSRLLDRIQTLLQENSMKSATVRPLYRWLIGIALLIAIVVLPAFVIAPVVAGHGSHIELSSNMFGGNYTKVRIDENGLKLSAEIRGDIEFNAAETDVVALGNGDEAWIEQDVGGVVRRIEFEQKGVKLVRRYFVDERAQALDAAGHAWLRVVIPTLFRESGIEAEARARRIHTRGGANAVLDEIALIRGNYVRKIHVSALVGFGPMRPVELGRAIALAGAIESDFERRESFVALIENQALGPQQQVALLGSVATMEGDFEKRSVLEALAPKMSDQPAVGAAWARTLGSMSGSFERREALVAVAKRSTLAPAISQLALRAIPGIDSDFEERTALEAFAKHVAGRPNLTASYVKATRSIESDFERREALLAVLDKAPLDAFAARAVLDAVAEMSSDFEKGEVLTRVASRMPEDADLIARYREVARGMADYERGQAEKALDHFAG